MSSDLTELLKSRLQQVLLHKNLDGQRELAYSMATELDIEFIDFAAALLYLTSPKVTPQNCEPTVMIHTSSDVKLLRYRLSVGSNHCITVEQLRKVLVNESGVDINHLNYVNIQPDYTIVELPDAMPADIFQHLRTVEIHQQKLAIKRVRPRNTKKRTKHHLRRGRQRTSTP